LQQNCGKVVATSVANAQQLQQTIGSKKTVAAATLQLQKPMWAKVDESKSITSHSLKASATA